MATTGVAAAVTGVPYMEEGAAEGEGDKTLLP